MPKLARWARKLAASTAVKSVSSTVSRNDWCAVRRFRATARRRISSQRTSWKRRVAASESPNDARCRREESACIRTASASGANWLDHRALARFARPGSCADRLRTPDSGAFEPVLAYGDDLEHSLHCMGDSIGEGQRAQDRIGSRGQIGVDPARDSRANDAAGGRWLVVEERFLQGIARNRSGVLWQRKERRDLIGGGAVRHCEHLELMRNRADIADLQYRGAARQSGIGQDEMHLGQLDGR